MKALEEIGELIEGFAQKRFGTNNMVNIPGVHRFLVGDGADLDRRFQPYPR